MLLRNIPVYDEWVCSYNGGGGNNAYLSNNNDEFEELARGILEERLPSLVERGYAAVCGRSLDKTGKLLIKAYERAVELCKQRQSLKQ